MFCPKCSHDKFTTNRTKRNLIYNQKRRKWIYSDNVDTRYVTCLKCGSTYLTSTEIYLKVELQGDGRSTVEDSGEPLSA